VKRATATPCRAECLSLHPGRPTRPHGRTCAVTRRGSGASSVEIQDVARASGAGVPDTAGGAAGTAAARGWDVGRRACRPEEAETARGQRLWRGVARQSDCQRGIAPQPLRVAPDSKANAHAAGPQTRRSKAREQGQGQGGTTTSMTQMSTCSTEDQEGTQGL